jgi:sirohydrochlorin ferrochelatase
VTISEPLAQRPIRCTTLLRRHLLLVLTLLAGLGLAGSAAADTGILLLAHGGSDQWNGRVLALAKQVDATQPTEVAFGMATRSAIDSALQRLKARGVSEIVAVPLFVSSYSSVITATEYLLKLRPDAPKDLATFAAMDHSHGHEPAGAAARPAGDAGAVPGTQPIDSPVPIRAMTPALNDHPIVAEILKSRARTISRTPAQEAVILVAHGPSPEADNRKWLTDMQALATRFNATEGYASVDVLTLRDDAAKPVRDAATAELRQLVERRIGESRRILIVPLLMSFGGIEKGLITRLEGLPYAMTEAALMPDDRLATWVIEMAKHPGDAGR